MRIIKKVVFDPFVSVYAWTCEKCTSEMQAEQSDVNALNDGVTVKLYVACPVCSCTHYVDDKQMSVEAVAKAVEVAPVFFDPQVKYAQMKAQALEAATEAATLKINEAITAAAIEAGVDEQTIIDGLKS